jgi:myo-inositol-1(or 4)-monophosphatase
MADQDEYLSVAVEAVRAAARVVEQWVGRIEVRHKGPADLVTQADLASQQTVRRIVLGAFPEHRLLGEEQCPEDSRELTAPGDVSGENPDGSRPATGECRWIVDPVDGTTNYVHGVPHYCISLGLECGGELLVGAVYDPALDECFTASRGRGAWLNGRPIRTSGVTELSDALAAVGFPTSVASDSPDLLMFLDMLPRCQAIRRTGCSALNLCYLAAGRFDLYWSYCTKIWDVAAGALLVQEAGGCISSPSGGPFELETAQFLAAGTPALHAKLCQRAEQACHVKGFGIGD